MEFKLRGGARGEESMLEELIHAMKTNEGVWAGAVGGGGICKQSS